MSALLTGIIGAIKGASITAKIITGAIALTVVGGGTTAVVLITSNDSNKPETTQEESKSEDERKTDETKTEEKATDTNETPVGETTDEPTNNNPSSNNNGSTVAKKTQYRYRDKEFTTVGIGQVGFGADGSIAYTGWNYLQDIVISIGEWSEWRSNSGAGGAGGVICGGNSPVEYRNNGTEVRRRSIDCQYKFWRWGAWSNWQDGNVSGNANREVETRQI